MNPTVSTQLMDCKAFQNELPDLVLTPNAVPSVAAVAHLQVCPPCTEEYRSFQQTFGLLDSWQPIDPTPYFDSKLQARVRAEQAAPAMGWFESLQTRLLFNTGRSFRPVLAGALALVLAVGGGSLIGMQHFGGMQPPSPTVNDLQILDHNEQAFQQLDELQKDDDGDNDPGEVNSQTVPPTS